MRPISSSLYGEMTGSVVRPVIAAELFLDSGTVRVWTGVGDLTYDGNTYVGTGNLGSISSMDSDGNLSANGITLSLSGVPVEVLGIALSESYSNRRVIVHIILFNTEGNIIGGNKVFVGRIDTASITRAANECTVTLSVENHTINLDRARIRRYTEIDQKQFVDKLDKCFEYITRCSGDLAFVWGAKVMTFRGGYGGNIGRGGVGGDTYYNPGGGGIYQPIYGGDVLDPFNYYGGIIGSHQPSIPVDPSHFANP